MFDRFLLLFILTLITVAAVVLASVFIKQGGRQLATVSLVCGGFCRKKRKSRQVKTRAKLFADTFFDNRLLAGAFQPDANPRRLGRSLGSLLLSLGLHGSLCLYHNRLHCRRNCGNA